MKKLTTILAALALIISTSAFANSGEKVTETKVTETVKTAFQKNFAAARNVSWQIAEEFYFAHFELGNDDLSVAYNDEGRMVGISRIINKEALPAAVANSLKEQYGSYEISPSITMINLEGETSYYVIAGGKKSVLHLKCSEDGKQIDVEKTTKRKVLVGRVY